MRNLIALLLFALSASTSQAQSHDHHANHNMLVYGESQIFISHLVYKVPHNYQVILKAELPNEVQALYLKERAQYPKDQFIFVFENMPISQIASAQEVSGEFYRIDQGGNKVILHPHVSLQRSDFEILYFAELPVQLQ